MVDQIRRRVARHLIFALCVVGASVGLTSLAGAATVGCGRVTTFVAPNSSGALLSGDGWVIFGKSDGSSEKVILRAGGPVGPLSGYICVTSEGVYLTEVLSPSAAGYIPEPADQIIPGTAVYCGTVAANPFTSGQISGARTLQLRGGLSASAEGIFSVPASIALPAIGSYLCGRFEPGGPSRLVTVVHAGDPGYVAALPNTSTEPATPALPVLGLFAAGVVLLGAALLRRRIAYQVK
jgi:hypothetical protein